MAGCPLPSPLKTSCRHVTDPAPQVDYPAPYTTCVQQLDCGAWVFPGADGTWLCARQQPWQAWGRHLASQGVQSALVADSPFYKLLIGRILGYRHDNIAWHIRVRVCGWAGRRGPGAGAGGRPQCVPPSLCGGRGGKGGCWHALRCLDTHSSPPSLV